MIMEAEIRAMRFEDGGRGHELRIQALLEANKDQETGSPLKGQKGKRTNLFCFKPQFVVIFCSSRGKLIQPVNF